MQISDRFGPLIARRQNVGLNFDGRAKRRRQRWIAIEWTILGFEDRQAIGFARAYFSASSYRFAASWPRATQLSASSISDVTPLLAR